MAGRAPGPIRVNRAPVLTLWAATVAEALGHPEDTALTLGSVVAGTAARAKARRLGIAAEREGTEKPERAPPAQPTVRLLGREISVTQDEEGQVAAVSDGRPQSAAAVRSYVARAFGDRLDEVRAAMRHLAASLPPDDLNRAGFRLYERFRPEMREGASGWRAKAELRIEAIERAAGD